MLLQNTRKNHDTTGKILWLELLINLRFLALNTGITVLYYHLIFQHKIRPSDTAKWCSYQKKVFFSLAAEILDETNTVVCGGGGAEGASHLGSFQVLQEQEVPIHRLIGTSIGAFVSVLFA